MDLKVGRGGASNASWPAVRDRDDTYFISKQTIFLGRVEEISISDAKWSQQCQMQRVS